jgi:hypothetical protein
LLGLVAAFALVGVSSAAAAPTWLAPSNISLSTFRSLDPEVSLNPGGEAIATWTGADLGKSGQKVQAASRPAGGSWPTLPQFLSLDGGVSPDLSFNPAGPAIAAWSREVAAGESVIEVADRAQWGTASNPISEASKESGSFFPRVAINSSGDAVAVWQQCTSAEFENCFPEQGKNGKFQVEVAVRRSGVWSTPKALGAPGENAIKVQTAISAGGNVVVVWEDELKAVHAAILKANETTWNEKVLAEGDKSGSPQVAFDAAGNATAVWDIESEEAFRIEASTVNAGSTTWSSPVMISGPLADDALDPMLSVAPAGAALVAWRGEVTNAIEATVRSTAGAAWGPVATVGPAGAKTRRPNVGLNAQGQGIVTWQRETGGISAVEAAVLSGGTWSAPKVVSNAGTSSVESDAAIDGQGNAVVIWRTETSPGNPQLVQVAEYLIGGTPPPPPPAKKSGTASATKRASVKGGAAWITLTCNKVGKCAGVAKLTTTYKGKNRLLGKKAFSIASGKTRVVKVPLSRFGKQLLSKRGGTLRVKLSGTHLRVRNVVLSLPKRRS